MSMIPCPGCGLPRVEEQIGSVPCPVCADGGTPPAAPKAPAKKAAGPDPTAGMPADVSAMHLAVATGGGFGFPAWFGWVSVFALGVAAGVGGMLAWQSGFSRGSRVEVAKTEPEPQALPQLPPRRLELAPMPHEPTPRPPETDPDPEVPPSDPKAGPAQPLPGQQVTWEEHKPEGTFTLPFSMKKGERVTLKGKVKTFRATGLDGGAILDASELEATNIYISGKIDNRSVLKLKSPSGTVTITASVTGHSTVEIIAPGGDVKFSAATTPTRPGSSIEGGAIVTITARTVELKGDVNGIDTKVTVTLPRTGSLKAAAVRGIATVEYRVVGDGKGVPDASATIVSPTANFRKIE